MTKKRIKLAIEGTTTWIYRETNEKFENLRNSLVYKDPYPHFYVPQITIGYFPSNKEKSKLNAKPIEEK